MLKDWPAEAVLPANDLDRAGRFYRDFLGLTVERDIRGVLLVHGGENTLFELALSAVPPCDNEALSFHVGDVQEEVRALRHAGVTIEERDDPPTTEGIAEVDGVRMAWFRDSEGNVVGMREG